MQRLANGGGFSFAMVSDSESEIVLKVTGKGAVDLFSSEAGGHRWQRVPPTEQNGRRHSSTFTVAILGGSEAKAEFDESEIEFEATIGHGPGGQHRNKTATAIRATHKATGIVVFIQSERSQQANKQRAIETIRDRVLEIRYGESHGKKNDTRKNQIGSGERSDKIRTVQEQNDRVLDHRTGRQCNVAAYRKGEIWKLQ